MTRRSKTNQKLGVENHFIGDRLRLAMKATGLSTQKAVVEEGLRLLIKVKGQEGICRLRGKGSWDGNLDVVS